MSTKQCASYTIPYGHNDSKVIDGETFEKYQRFTEQTIANLSNEITKLEEKLDVFTNLLEISQYINQYIKSQDLFPLINDMLIGVFGAKYCTIYIKSDADYIPVTPRQFSAASIDLEKALIYKYHQHHFVINSEEPIYQSMGNNQDIYSCLGVPIQINSAPLGFVIIQHQQKYYFTNQHSTFLSSLANHIGVAIENNILYNKIVESASKDGLTNIFNKKYFLDTISGMPNLEQLNYSIVMIDIDNFKMVNDTYGHPYGDEVLKTICSLLKHYTRPKDIVARYGGEEIIIFFNQFTNEELLRQRLESIRQKIQETQISGDTFTSSVTASFGCYIKEDHPLSLDSAIKYADDNLYICKRSGKNKVIISKQKDVI
ncbi:MAG: diguanylate cyclase [Cellulosilyticum sp.]|nr:diguanylate cyclase [Cellulosilyticum sp.]